MSKPKNWWHGNVIRVIRAYPALKQAKQALQAVSVTAGYSGMPGSHEPGRTTEASAIRQLAPREEDDLRAVERAIETIGQDQYAQEVMKVVDLYFWSRGGSLEDIGSKLCMSRETVKRRKNRFYRAVAKNMGYLRKLS